jgi:hypothetical protein
MPAARARLIVDVSAIASGVGRPSMPSVPTLATTVATGIASGSASATRVPGCACPFPFRSP